MLPKYESPKCYVDYFNIKKIIRKYMRAPSATSVVRMPLQVLFRIRVACLGFMNGMRKKKFSSTVGQPFSEYYSTPQI